MIKKIFLILVIIIGLFSIGYYILTNISFVDEEIDNIVDTQIEEPQLTKDVVGNLNICLINTEKNTLVKENRNVSLKELNKTPYDTILKQLKIPSSSTNLLCPIPENCTIISIINNQNTLEITLSKEFIEQNVENNKDKLILESIVSTINNLKEVEKIKINIENSPTSSLGNYSLDKTYSILDFKEE